MAVLGEDYQEFKNKLIAGGTDLVAELGKFYADMYDKGMKELDELADKIDDYLDDTVEWINESFEGVSVDVIRTVNKMKNTLSDFAPEVSGNVIRMVDAFVDIGDELKTKKSKGEVISSIVEEASDVGISWVIRQFSDEKVPLNKGDSKRELAKTKAKESGESKLADIIDDKQLKKIAKDILPKKGYTWLTELL
jgi:hypothetical protein